MKKKEIIIAHDVGTGGNKAVCTDLKGKVLFSHYIPYQLIHPKPGWVEQNPEELWNAVSKSTRNVLMNIDLSFHQIIGVCLSGQMLNIIPLNEKGQPLSNMISWLDTRSISQADRIIEDLGDQLFIREVANLPTGKDIIPKMLWIREKWPQIWKKTYKLCDCKEYILFRMTGKFAVDWNDASLYFLFDPRKRDWSKTLCEKLEIPLSMLPEAHSCIKVIGEVTPEASKQTGIPSGTPVVIGAGDAGMAQVGAGAVRNGKVNLMAGTSLLLAVSIDRFINDNKKPFLGMCHVDPKSWIIGGAMETGGGSLMWFRDTLCDDITVEAKRKGVSAYQLMSEIAVEIPPGSDNLIFTPWLAGERSPVLNHYLRGAFIGLTLGHSKAHMVRAIMEGVSYHLRWIRDRMQNIGIQIDSMHAMGGSGTSDMWMQIMSDVLGIEIRIVKNAQEAGAVGAALTTAVGLGVYPSLEIADDLVRFSKTFYPKSGKAKKIYDAFYKEYIALYEALSPIYRRMHTVNQINS
ncbi:MAG: FGGY-family carbohydrate kinase [Spirochaetes bacterium]|nr:FGGY-family carbohydrate kinase [Spirochaetota bacterium]